ncbi:MAG: diguanylate cyclase [Acidimicrobiia bacterium]
MSRYAATAERARALLSHPGKVAAILPAIGALAIVSVVPLRHWPSHSLLVLLIAAGTAAINAALRATLGSRLPSWSLQLDIAMGNLMVTVAVAVGRGQHIHLENLYLLVVVFTVLYFSARAALVHLALAGAAFAVVVALGPSSGDPPGLEWVSVFGTAVVFGAVTYGLVSVLRIAALQDPLTGLANRRSWDERLDEEIQRSQRAGAALSVAMIDLDGFKAVNDRDGHAAGDDLLRSLAQAWTCAIRGGGDFLARVGGDEFALLAPDSDTAGTARLIERLHDVSPEGVSWTIGIATWDGTERAQDLMRRADRSMYETKQRRRHDDQIHLLT